MFKLAVTIPSDTRYLSSLRQMVDAVAHHVGRRHFPKAARQSVSLALIEAVDNAIFHAHGKRSELPIDVILTADEHYIRVEVGDCGEGLNHRPAERPDQMSTRGRGLFLINSMMSKVESVKRANNHWMRMTYYL